MSNDFTKDVVKGLTSNPKYLSSKYFYDETGDKIFQKIMMMPEYYLTESELEILTVQKDKLLFRFTDGVTTFHLIEFGAGDGLKTKILLDYFLSEESDFIYNPIDISRNVLKLLTDDLSSKFPSLRMEPLNKEYFKALDDIRKQCCGKKVLLFLGSNVGNFSEAEAIAFYSGVAGHLDRGDLILTGFDLQKDPKVILKAYNDPAGITLAFNLNLLNRINRELGGNFDTGKFIHHPVYNPVTGATISYLLSSEKHEVWLSKIDLSVVFDQWEPIFMEVSQKYSLEMIGHLAAKSGFSVLENYFDSRNYFTDSLWILS